LGLLADALTESENAFLRGFSPDIGLTCFDPIASSQRVSQEIKRFFRHVADACLLLVHLQFQLLHHLCHLRLCLSRFVVAEDYEVVGIVDDMGL
jgi:hypothetical protein